MYYRVSQHFTVHLNERLTNKHQNNKKNIHNSTKNYSFQEHKQHSISVQFDAIQIKQLGKFYPLPGNLLASTPKI